MSKYNEIKGQFISDNFKNDVYQKKILDKKEKIIHSTFTEVILSDPEFGQKCHMGEGGFKAPLIYHDSLTPLSTGTMPKYRPTI